MQAIKVKYLGPTDTLGTRYKASTSNHSVTVDFDYDLDHVANQWAALDALTEKLNWRNKTWVRGVYQEDSYFISQILLHSDYVRK